MANHECEACIVTCIDFRLQEHIDKWVGKNFEPRTFDRVALAGGVKNLDIILEQIAVSSRLHHIQRVVLINHEDCGAYGEVGTQEKHAEDLKNASSQVKEELPDVSVETYYLHLNGTFEAV